ncbi:MAG: YtxH domain-containing protein [Candidatus Dormibacteria bacterium]
MGYVKGVSHGLAIGLAVGVLIAPRPGAETRSRLAAKYNNGKERAQRLSGQVQQGWRSAQPAIEKASRAAGGMAQAIRPAAQGASERLMELSGRRQSSEAVPPIPGFDQSQ